MEKETPTAADTSPLEVVIPKENAVFWMDGRGRWCNRHGCFEHKRIIDYFNQAIRRDGDGYYVTQIRGNIRERVYFAYVETPLFVVRVAAGKPLRLELNTGDSLPLALTRLFVRSDKLYQRRGEEIVKFSERALMDLAPLLEEAADGLMIRLDGRSVPILTDDPD